MPSSESSNSSANYKLLSNDTDVPFGFCIRCENKITPLRARRSRPRLLLWLNIVQAVTLLSLIVVLAVKHTPVDNSDPTDFWSLDKYNTTERGEDAFRVHNAADNSTESESFWHDLLQDFGLVILDQDWAEANNLPPTVHIPGEPTRRLYQIGAWHTFHCLKRVRDRLLKPGAGNDRHTMHCMDHLRTQTMCNPLLTLDGSVDFIAFDVHPDGQQCKDLGAIQRWARPRAWKGYEAHIQSLGLRVTEAEYLLFRDQQVYPGVGWDKVWFRETGLGGDGWLEIEHLDHIAKTPGEEAQERWLREKPADRFAWMDELAAKA
ncbi:putative Tat pathway signal sequence [Seiridium cardinale]